MTCSRTATSAPPMTVSVTPPSSMAAWAAARTASAPISRSTFCRYFRRPVRHGWRAAAAAVRAASAAPTCATTWKSASRRHLRGKTAQIRIPTSVTCEACSGTGAKAGTKPKQCATCGGAGKIRHAQGFFTLERTCPTCQGRGQVIDDPCPACGGAGRVTRERTLSVNIPPGVEDGTRIRLAGEGEAGLRGGPPGDLYIFLSLAPHEFFQRDGADLHCRVPISMATRGARRRIRGAGDRRQQGAGQSPGRDPDRPAFPAVRQGHAGAACETNRRHVRSGSGGNAAKPDQTPARTAGRVRKAVF